MANLIKFTCKNCSAKLAVPVHMGGTTDNCPKCGSLVTSPAYKPKDLARRSTSGKRGPQPPRTEAFSSAELADALRPAPPVAPPERVEAPAAAEKAPAAPAAEAIERSALSEAPTPESREPGRDPVKQPAPTPEERSAPKPEPAQDIDQGSSTKAKSSALETVARPAATAEVRPASAEADSAVPSGRDSDHQEAAGGVLTNILGNTQVSAKKTSPQLVSRNPKGVDHDPFANSRTALRPSVTTEEEAEKAAMPGMGEMLAANHSSLVSSPADGRPWQSVPFLPVSTSHQQARKLKLTRYRTLGIVAFLVLDVIAVVWLFQRPLLEWWSGKQQEEVISDPVPAEPVNTGPEEASIDDAELRRRLPRNPVPTLADIREPEISSPSDFPAVEPAPAEPSLKSVPQAIPIVSDSGHAVLPDLTDLPPAKAPEMAPLAPSVETPEITPLPTSSSVSNTSAPLPPPSAPPSPPPLPSGENVQASLGGLPPPPTDMAFPNGAPPPEVQTLVDQANVSSVATQVRISPVPPEARSALDALVDFLDATTYRERVRYTADTPALLLAMEKHAKVHGDGPILVGNIEFVERYTNKNGVPPYCMFEVSGGSLPHSVLVLVEQAAKGPAKVDWEAFIEFKDDLLLRFLEAKNNTPQKFRVMVRRKHYFDKDVPDMAGKDGFEVKQPNANFEGHVFVTRDSALGRQLANQLAWGMDMPIIAELAWKSQGSSNWVEIKSIPSYGWRN